jgi:hypothetical protein
MNNEVSFTNLFILHVVQRNVLDDSITPTGNRIHPQQSKH